MKELEKLNTQEKEQLFKTPAYVSLLAANADGEMDEVEKLAAIQFSHIKTFSSIPALTDFYKEVERDFSANIEELDQHLPKERGKRKEAINKELIKLIPIFSKLGNAYAVKLHQSFITYTEHVSKAHRNILTSFVIPLYIKGITD